MNTDSVFFLNYKPTSHFLYRIWDRGFDKSLVRRALCRVKEIKGHCTILLHTNFIEMVTGKQASQKIAIIVEDQRLIIIMNCENEKCLNKPKTKIIEIKK